MYIPDNCLNEFPLIQKGITQGIYSIDGESLNLLYIEDITSNTTWDKFITHFPNDKCCHAFTHFYYLSETDNVQRRKFVHVLWCPKNASQKDKMKITFFTSQVLLELGALGVGAASIEAESITELDYMQAKEKILRRVTVK